MLRVGLLSCSKQKLAVPAPARELYASDLFRKAAAYAERSYDCWFVLSARHGLVEPHRQLAPYDLALADLTTAERQAWALQVAAEINRRGLSGARFYLHCGRLYREPLQALLADSRLPFTRPLGIGAQKAWYLAAGRSRSRG